MKQGFAAVFASVISTVLFLIVYLNNPTIPNFTSAYGKLRNISPSMRSEASPESWLQEYYAKFAPKRAALLSQKDISYGVLFAAIVPEHLLAWDQQRDQLRQRHIQEFNNFTCKLYGYDKVASNNNISVEYEKINGKIEKVELASTTNASANRYFLGDLVERNNDTSIEILKIDIEGQEHESLVPFLKHYDVCQVLVEIHGGATKHISLLRNIAKLNYALFSYEVNGYARTACEYSFIHLNCTEKYGAYMLKRYLNEVV